MELDYTSKIKFDLESFLRVKQYYHCLSCIRKRCLLLYSPFDIEKSSFATAMTNFLYYDIYDIDL
ncbi:AAA-ATPase [Glycine max]|nr:AAA-ATPase [Glycine max]